jgi:spore maturation protein CgeB
MIQSSIFNLYIYSIGHNEALNGLLEYINKNMQDSIFIDISNKSCCAQKVQILKYLDSYNIRAIVNFDPVNICLDLDFLNKIKNDHGTKLIGYHADVPEYFDSYFVYVSQLYDMVLVDDYSELSRYHNYGYIAKNFYHGISQEYFVKSNTERNIDISFVGRMDRPGRKELFHLLQNKGFSVAIYGFGTRGGYISSEEMMSVYSRSKIVLNLTSVSTSIPFFERDKTINNRIKQAKGRILEGMASGAFILTEPAFSLSVIGNDGKDFVIFNSHNDLVEKLQYYLGNSKERISIAKSGFEQAVKSATHKSQASYLNLLIKQTPISNIGIVYLDKVYRIFISRNISYRFLKSLMCFKKPDFSSIYLVRIDFLVFNFLWTLFYYSFKKIKNKLKISIK